VARAVVTGGAGFLGSAVAHALRRRGDQVVAVDVRRGPGVLPGDVTRPDGWAHAVAGADLLVHAAGVATGGFADPSPVAGRAATGRGSGAALPAGELSRVNIGGADAVLRAAERAGVSRIVVLSSLAVLDAPGGAQDEVLTEDDPVRATGDPGADSVAAAEHRALAAAARGVPVTIVRAGEVYGPRGGRWTLRPVALIRARRFALVDGGRGLLAPVHVDDLVDAVLALAGAKEAAGEVVHVTGGAAVPAGRFFGHYVRMLDAPAPPSVPAAVARGLAGLAGLSGLPGSAGRPGAGRPGLAGRLASRADPRVRFDIGPAPVAALTRTRTYSLEKIDRLVGWRPRIDLDEGMARTGAQLAERGLLGTREPARRG
jgi:2-alkyl-3-oxoalkanoate reductase